MKGDAIIITKNKGRLKNDYFDLMGINENQEIKWEI